MDYLNSSGDYAGYFEGQVVVNGRHVITSSDRALKDDIQPISEALQVVRALKPSSYKLKKDKQGEKKGKTHYGFVAQEIEEILPELVSDITLPSSGEYFDQIDATADTTGSLENVGRTVNDPSSSQPRETVKGVRYGDLIAILAQALQEEDAIVKDHEKKIKEEKEKNNGLRSEINTLREIIAQLDARLTLVEACTECGIDKKSTSVPKKSMSMHTPVLQEVGYSVYPNPTADRLTVEGPATESNLRLYLHDGQGRRVLDLPFSNGRSELHIGTLPAGSYHLEIFDEGTLQSVGGQTVILR